MGPALTPERQRVLDVLRSRGRCGGFEIVARTLREVGITHVFVIGGAPVDAALGACARAGIRVIGARHQQGAVLMSLAYNYVSGALRSAVIVSAGPAVTNCATGVLFGHDNRWPLLVIGGRRGGSPPGGFQAFDGARFFAPIAKWTDCVIRTADLRASLVQAARAAVAGAPGPVYLDVEAEAFADYAEAPPPTASPGQAPFWPDPGPAANPIDPTSLRDAVSLLSRARRPAMLIGKGARWSHSSAPLGRLADEFSIPFATSPMGRGLLPDDHRLCFSALRGGMLAEADLVLVIGARFD